MSKGAATSPTLSSPDANSRSTMARRVGSASAPKISYSGGVRAGIAHSYFIYLVINISDLCGQARTPCDLLDDAVGPRQYARRDVDAELFCRLEVDDQFKPGGLHHGQIGRLFALQDTRDVESGLMPGIRKIRPVTEKASGNGIDG